MPKDSSTGWLILLCGLHGSGKTTVGRQLEAELDAVRFCPDEWMARLGIDLFDQPARAEIESLQWQLAERLLRNGDTVVIESGVWSRSERDELRAVARNLGAWVELRYLHVPLDVLWDRVRDRGTDQRTGTVALTRENLMDYEAMFEPPSDAELTLYDAPIF